MNKKDKLEQAIATRQSTIDKLIGRNKNDKKELQAVIDKKKEGVEDEYELVEKWECRKCGDDAPCRIEIIYSDAKLPEHLKGNERFRDKRCFCKESRFSEWKRQAKQAKVGEKSEQGKSEPELRHGDYGPHPTGGGDAWIHLEKETRWIGHKDYLGHAEGMPEKDFVKVRLGNLIDDLTETSEGFEMENGRYSDVSVDHYDDHIHIRQDTVNSIIVHNDKLPEFHRKLGHVLNHIRKNK